MKPFLRILTLFLSLNSLASQEKQKLLSQDQKDTTKFLDEAQGNLVEAEDLQGEGLLMLAAQKERLVHIRKHMNRLNKALDHCDQTLTELEDPWFPRKSIIRSGKSIKHKFLQETSYKKNSSLIFEGVMYKQSKILKRWDKRFFQLEDNLLSYSIHKGDEQRKGMFELKDFEKLEPVLWMKKALLLLNTFLMILKRNLFFSQQLQKLNIKHGLT